MLHRERGLDLNTHHNSEVHPSSTMKSRQIFAKPIYRKTELCSVLWAHIQNVLWHFQNGQKTAHEFPLNSAPHSAISFFSRANLIEVPCTKGLEFLCTKMWDIRQSEVVLIAFTISGVFQVNWLGLELIAWHINQGNQVSPLKQYKRRDPWTATPALINNMV